MKEINESDNDNDNDNSNSEIPFTKKQSDKYQISISEFDDSKIKFLN